MVWVRLGIGRVKIWIIGLFLVETFLVYLVIRRIVGYLWELSGYGYILNFRIGGLI